MKALFLLFCVSAAAHADLYRWIDPETGSVKLSSLPPSEAGVNAKPGLSSQDFQRGGLDSAGAARRRAESGAQLHKVKPK